MEDRVHSEAECAEILAENVGYNCSEIFASRLAWIFHVECDKSAGTANFDLQTGVPVISDDITVDRRFKSCCAAVLAEGFSVSAAFPLINSDQTIGTLYLFSDQPGFFTPERIGIIRAYTLQAAAALENARLLEAANSRLRYLHALRSIDRVINASRDKQVIFKVILDQLTTKLGVHAADILVFNQHTQTLDYSAGRGFRSNDVERLQLHPGEGYVGNALLEHKLVHLTDLTAAGDKFPHAQLLAGDDFIDYQALPLISKGQVKGVLEIYHRTPADFNGEWLDFLKNFTDQVAAAINQAALVNSLQRSNAELSQTNNTLAEIWLRDKETDDRSQFLAKMTLTLAKSLGIEEDELVHIHRGALLHDIGEIDIPKNILQKPGKLTNEEYELIRSHTTRAYEMLSPFEDLRPALDIPYCHHEKWDGTGYPRGLAGEQIPLAARIFAVVDVWSALCSDRPYRPAWNKEKALVYISEQAGKQFDKKVVEVFMDVVLQTSPSKVLYMR
jgi:HD-GYP domain-containing protein (c-di-GMP phosphodiesterase class II)